MADLQSFLQKALDKEKTKAEKAEVKPPKKVTKGVRPYNFPVADGMSEADRRFLEASAPDTLPEISTFERPVVVELKAPEAVVPVHVEQPRVETTVQSTSLAAAKLAPKVRAIDESDIKFAKQEYDGKYSDALKNLGKGYTRFPNEILIRVMSGDIEPREVRLLLAILRLSAGFGQTWVSISSTYLEDLTGIAKNHLFKAIRSLSDKGIIERRAGSDSERKTANQYRVLFDGKNSYLEYSQDEAGFSEAVETYLNSILVKAQREIERKSVRELIDSGITQDEVIEGVRMLQERGMPGSGERPNNPAAFLARSGSKIFEDIRRRQARKNTAIKAELEPVATEQTAADEISKIELRFNEEFPSSDLRDSKIKELVEKYGILKSGSFQVPWVVAEKLAIQKWHEELKS